MPLDPSIKKVMVIGSGPIVIGQAAEFDYAGTQACRALKEDGLNVVLVNSNPATIMTDNAMADRIYLEPLTLPTIKRIIKKERPDSILPNLGGQTGLTLAMQLAAEGFLDKYGVKLLGAKPETIDKAEDRLMFKETMESIDQPCIPSVVVNTVEDAVKFAEKIGYPVIVRPAFTLGGTGGGMAYDHDQLVEICENGLRLSPITQVLIEQSVAGWKEIEFEVIRDSLGNAITVCSMENVDPVGIHTGDSIVVAPALTLSTKEYNMLRTASLKIVEALGVEGGCNCQFALNPNSMEYAVIEVNPRVSRSSALASKATGYPIAKMAAKIAVGYTLPELKNAVTGTTSACFEPSIDYVVVKLPKWPFDKFVYAKRTLGTQMQATGEVMSIGASFESAIMKAVRGAAISQDTLSNPVFAEMTDEEVFKQVGQCDDRRFFAVYEAIKRGMDIEEIFNITKIDRFFLYKLRKIANIEKELAGGLTDELYVRAKEAGFLDKTIKKLSGCEITNPLTPVYKMVDTCAAEFAANTPYFYSTFDKENEAREFIDKKKNNRPTVVVLGSGPIRIGQGIEFDYASVHCVWALKRKGFDVVIINNNPETVSTDFDTADRLYFEPITPEDVMGILATEKPYGVVVAFGGQTAISLTKFLDEQGVRILGTGADSIDRAEDRERFDELLEQLDIKRPRGLTVMTKEEALQAAEEIGYPVLLRPSYVLGGQNMIIAFNEDDVKEYMDIILSHEIENPILIDQYLMGTELEVDAICDGERVLIPGIMQHIERAGVHSGDSIAVYPPYNVDDDMIERITDCSARLAAALDTRGLINMQYLIFNNTLYVIEVNPRASRTIPYISKVTGVPMVDLATRAMLGESLMDMGYGTGLYKIPPYVAVKVPVFSFEKLASVDTHLGPEMKSTGEALGLAGNLDEALYKGLVAAGYNLERKGGILFTVRKTDRAEIADTAKRFEELGFTLYATPGTARSIRQAGIDVIEVDKIQDNEKENVLTLIEQRKVNFIVSTSAKGRIPTRASVQMRRKAVEHSIPCLTSIDTANAVADSIKSRYSLTNTELVDINRMRHVRTTLPFTKMQGVGNDCLFFDCIDKCHIDNPEGLAVKLLNRHYGVGGEALVTINPSDKADASMFLYNRDGSLGETGGNAIRSVAKYLYEHDYVSSKQISIETTGGIKNVTLHSQNGKVVAATVNMGKVSFNAKQIPMMIDCDKVVNYDLEVDGTVYKVNCMNIGNPHAVVFVDDLRQIDIEKIGPMIENHPIFPDRINVEFVKVLSSETLRMRAWERGSGETWACGSGAAAAFAAAVENGYCDKKAVVTVKLVGGDLSVSYKGDELMLRGGTATLYEGNVIV